MEQIAVDRTGPKAFILVPDDQFSAFEPENDQIWALSLDPSESGPFHLYTTYQLRARSMRVFPNLLISQQRLIKPGNFYQLPTITACTPSALTIEYSFVNALQARFSVFAPEPHVLVGMLMVINAGHNPVSLRVEMGTILIPMDKGHPTHPDTIGSNHILSGQTTDLYPVLFMSGGPTATSNPHPALHTPLRLEPGQSKEVQWALVSKTSQLESYTSARGWIAQNWSRDLQIHTKSHEKNIVFIKTGQPDWDATFYLAQVNALTHLVNLDPNQTQPTFIRTRTTDQPKRPRLQEKLLSDLTLLDTLHLAQVLLPAHLNHLTSLFEQFITRVNEQGKLPSSILQGGNGRIINEPPLLAGLCLMLYEINHDTGFLQRSFPNLKRFFEAGWLNNGLEPMPVWDTPLQLQLENGLFNFDIWEETGNGLDIGTAQSPAKMAMLSREAFALGKIAHILGDRSARNKYVKWSRVFQEKMRALWNETHGIFSYQDLNTHQAPPRELYYPGRVQSKLDINKQFNQPQRLQILLISKNKHPHAPEVRFTGQNPAGETAIEMIQPSDLRWVNHRAHYTTRTVYSNLETVHFEGFNPDDRFLIKTADYTQPDISCLLPVWSGSLQKDQRSALREQFLNDPSPITGLGIPDTWQCHHPLPDGLPTPINIQWNTLIIDGLAKAGLSTQCVNLFTNLMATMIRGLKDFNGFYPLFDHENGVPIGTANTITGLAPLSLFLKIAGIKLLSPHRVALWGKNPFPWPIEVRWQGLWLSREGAQSQIVFPDGSHYDSLSTKSRIVKSEKGE